MNTIQSRNIYLEYNKSHRLLHYGEGGDSNFLPISPLRLLLSAALQHQLLLSISEKACAFCRTVAPRINMLMLYIGTHITGGVAE